MYNVFSMPRTQLVLFRDRVSILEVQALAVGTESAVTTGHFPKIHSSARLLIARESQSVGTRLKGT